MHKHLHHRTFFFWEISQINACHCSQQNKHFWELCSFSFKICICIFFYSIGFAKEAFYTCKNNRNASVNSSRAQHQPPTPPPRLLRGICPPCQSQGWGISKFCAARRPGICQPSSQPQAFDTHEVSYQNITRQRILLEKQVDWLICQGWEKIVEV